MNLKHIALCISLIAFIAMGASITDTASAQGISKVAGEAFGRPVTEDEFDYYLRTARILTRTGKAERSEDEVRQEAWEDLVYLREAATLSVAATDDEFKQEMERLLKEKDLKVGTDTYKTFIRGQFGEPVEQFEKRVRDLVTINKLLKAKSDPDVTVTEEEMKEKFLNQYNSFESEYIRFETEEEAKAFAGKFKDDAKLWKETYDAKKPLGQKGASWINIMSLEALIDLWKIPKADAYAILAAKNGDLIVAHYYYGIAVFRLLNKREADLKEYDAKKQEYFRDAVSRSKKYKLSKDYLDDMVKRANIKDYVAEETKGTKLQELKMKSKVALETNQGTITFELRPEVAPKACENFVGLIERGYYNGIIFHRVIKDFMVQGGDPTGTGTGGQSMWGTPFQDETSDKVKFDGPGILAMANSGPGTNGSQFFITTKATPWLEGRHTIFGKVVSGYDVVSKIESVEADPANNKPKKEQKIVRAYIVS